MVEKNKTKSTENIAKIEEMVYNIIKELLGSFD